MQLIAQYRMAQELHVEAQLVGSSSHRQQPDPGDAGPIGQHETLGHLPAGEALPTFGRARGNDPHSSMLLARETLLTDGSVHFARIVPRPAQHERIVPAGQAGATMRARARDTTASAARRAPLSHAVLLELHRQRAVSLRSSSESDEA